MNMMTMMLIGAGSNNAGEQRHGPTAFSTVPFILSSDSMMQIDDQRMGATSREKSLEGHETGIDSDCDSLSDDDDASASMCSSSNSSCCSRSCCNSNELDHFQSSSCFSLNLRHGIVCDKIVQHMASLHHSTHLRELWLGPTFDRPQTVLSSVTFLPKSLRHLDLDLRNSLHMLPQVLPLVFRHTHLKTLGLRLFGDSGTIELAKWLHCNPNLQTLDLRGNRIGSDGARAIVDALVDSNHGLSTLILSCNCIVDGDMVARLLSHPRSRIRVLDLSFNWIDDSVVRQISQALCTNKNSCLQELNLFGCQRLSKLGFQALLHCLEFRNTSLQHVHIHAYCSETLRLRERMEDWLLLNRHGRYLLHCDITAGLWPHILAKCNNEPTALFHFLRQVPRLVM
jgi:hypothetical protein